MSVGRREAAPFRRFGRHTQPGVEPTTPFLRARTWYQFTGGRWGVSVCDETGNIQRGLGT